MPEPPYSAEVVKVCVHGCLRATLRAVVASVHVMRPCAIAMFDYVVIIQDIFKLFFIQLRLLRDNDENFQKRFTLLETLATLKMPLLLVEICRAEDSRDHDDAPLIDMFNTLLEIALYVLPAMFVVLFSVCLDVCGRLT